MGYFSDGYPEHPQSFHLTLLERPVTFVRVEPSLYAAEVDGQRRSIRVHREEGYVSEGGSNEMQVREFPAAPAVNLDALLRCLECDPQPSRDGDWLELRGVDNWGHYRQNTHLRLMLRVGADGVVELFESIGVEDGSYY